MGLDIYLYRGSIEACNEREAAEEAASDICQECGHSMENQHYTEPTEAETAAELTRDLLAPRPHRSFPCRVEGCGCADFKHKPWDSDDWKSRQVEIDSTTDPEHLCKIGYFRSSYNAGGFDSVTRLAGVPDFYQLFDHSDHDEYEFVPDWKRIIERCDAWQEAWAAAEERLAYSVHDVTIQYARMLREAQDKGKINRADPFNSMINNRTQETDVLERFFKEKRELEELVAADADKPGDDIFKRTMDEQYSKGDMEWFGLQGMQVVAAIPGFSILGDPALYLVFKADRTDREWYRKVPMILKETCQWVLSQPDPSDFHVHWSG